METVLFFWSKGAETRRQIVKRIAKCEEENEPCYINSLSDYTGLSHVAVKKHVDLLIEKDYLDIMNPGGKPKYLTLTDKGLNILEEIKKHKDSNKNSESNN